MGTGPWGARLVIGVIAACVLLHVALKVAWRDIDAEANAPPADAPQWAPRGMP